MWDSKKEVGKNVSIKLEKKVFLGFMPYFKPFFFYDFLLLNEHLFIN